MRIIRIFTSGRLGEKQKIKQQNGFAPLIVRGGANALTPPVYKFLFSTMQNFFNSPQEHYYKFQQIFHIITPSKCQYKKRGKITIHYSPKNVKRGGGNRKNGGLQGWLEMGIPPSRNWRSFSVSLYSQNALLSGFVKVPFPHFPQYWFISSSRVYNHIVVVYIGNSQNFTIALY